MLNWSYRKIFFVSLALHLVCAIFSIGFQHGDEHVQVYEFLNFKLGGLSEDLLPWEFRDQVRPWIQVYFYYFITKISNIFGAFSPFSLAMIFRISSAILGVVSLWGLIPLLKDWFSSERYSKLSYIMLNLFWFMPFLHVRTSADFMSGCLFIFGMSFFLRSLKSNHIMMALMGGLFLGASYNVRYQLALMIAFLWFWAIGFSRKSTGPIIVSALAIGFMIGAGVVVDYFGYGEWTFAPYNLFVSNFLDHRLKNSGEDPFWFYVVKSFKVGIPPLSLALIVATSWGIFKKYKHPLTWAIVPLLIFHTMIGHKELRYIYPIVFLSPIYLAWFFEAFEKKYLNENWSKRLIGFFVVINFLLLTFVLFKPAKESLRLYKFLYDKDIKTVYTPIVDKKKFDFTLHFYKKPSLKTIGFNPSGGSWNHKYILTTKLREKKLIEENRSCEVIFSSYPSWIEKVNFTNWLKRSSYYILWECR